MKRQRVDVGEPVRPLPLFRSIVESRRDGHRHSQRADPFDVDGACEAGTFDDAGGLRYATRV
jgi:hypothetical protein